MHGDHNVIGGRKCVCMSLSLLPLLSFQFVVVVSRLLVRWFCMRTYTIYFLFFFFNFWKHMEALYEEK